MNLKKIFSLLNYSLVRICCYPLSFLSYKTLHKIGYTLGPLLFYTLERYRKRTLSNLSLSDLSLEEKEKISLAKKSLGSLLATTLEYSKLSREKHIHNLVTCVNPEEANAIMAQGKGLVFFCGHQANWELFFLEGTARMPGVAIGQPVQNSYLYRWILSIRQKFGGLIVPPEQAIKQSLKALKEGKFLGIVGDQGMPSSGFCSPFLGRKAWTSPLPALLSYRTGAPLITATMKRENGRYFIHYSPALWPDKTKPMEEEISSLMKRALLPLEESIRAKPEEWLWQHNRWKQQPPGKIKKQYRHDALAVILPKDPLLWKELALDCNLFRSFYPTELLTFFTPFPLGLDTIDEYLYKEYDELLLIRDYCFKLIFNFTPQKDLSLHFKKLSALKTISLEELAIEANAPIASPLKTLITKAISHAS